MTTNSRVCLKKPFNSTFGEVAVAAIVLQQPENLGGRLPSFMQTDNTRPTLFIERDESNNFIQHFLNLQSRSYLELHVETKPDIFERVGFESRTVFQSI